MKAFDSKESSGENGVPRELVNHFLIASPDMQDPNFAKTVIFIAAHTPTEGAMGIVINREGQFRLSDACQQLSIEMDNLDFDMTFGWGGPVRPNAGFILHTPDMLWSNTVFKNSEVALSISPDVIRAVIEGQGPKKLYLALGCASWAPSQLEGELERGSWYVVPAEPRILFDLPIERRYEAALSLVGGSPLKRAPAAFFIDQIGHA